jgi:hypothetical protein
MLYEGSVWIYVAEDGLQRWTLENMVTDIRIL